jgi:hypothetical protein
VLVSGQKILCCCDVSQPEKHPQALTVKQRHTKGAIYIGPEFHTYHDSNTAALISCLHAYNFRLHPACPNTYQLAGILSKYFAISPQCIECASSFYLLFPACVHGASMLRAILTTPYTSPRFHMHIHIDSKLLDLCACMLLCLCKRQPTIICMQNSCLKLNSKETACDGAIALESNYLDQ